MKEIKGENKQHYQTFMRLVLLILGLRGLSDSLQRQEILPNVKVFLWKV